MNKSDFDYAQEGIRQALVQQYVKDNPGIRERDVVIACKNGKLFFTDITSFLADDELKNKSGTNILQANRMFESLPVHNDENWQDSIESVSNSRQIIDCLHSSPFCVFTDIERIDHLNSIKNLESLCAAKTVHYNDISKKMSALKEDGISLVTSRARVVILDYLYAVIDQLKTLLTIFNYEVKIGNLFLKQSSKFLDMNLKDNHGDPASFDLSQINNINKTMSGNNRLSIDDSLSFNENILIETRKTLLKTLQSMKKKLAQRRMKIQEIWADISALQQPIEELKNNYSDCRIIINNLKEQDSKNRMARFKRRP